MEVFKLSLEHNIKPFDCDDVDLNNFLFEDAKPSLGSLLSVTYLIENETHTVAYFSLLNDKISIDNFPSKRKFYRFFRDTYPAGKRYDSYPSLKIGRLAVNKEFSGTGIGTKLLDYIKIETIIHGFSGCQYLTVDAYAKSLTFYEKNGFEYLTDVDKGEETRLMYFDLRPLI